MEIQLLEQAKKVLEKNWQDGFTIPCEGLYPFQWNWDSGFIALGWAHIDMEKAKSELRYLLSGQWSNGFLPHIIFHNESESYFPGPEVHAANLSPYSSEIKTSGITQPPVLGFVLEELFTISGNTELDFILKNEHSSDDYKESLRVVQFQTKQMIHSSARIISELSRYMTLEPGDVIYTGTAGTTAALKEGDVVDVLLEGIGRLRNTVGPTPK